MFRRSNNSEQSVELQNTTSVEADRLVGNVISRLINGTSASCYAATGRKVIAMETKSDRARGSWFRVLRAVRRHVKRCPGDPLPPIPNFYQANAPAQRDQPRGAKSACVRLHSCLDVLLGPTIICFYVEPLAGTP